MQMIDRPTIPPSLKNAAHKAYDLRGAFPSVNVTLPLALAGILFVGSNRIEAEGVADTPKPASALSVGNVVELNNVPTFRANICKTSISAIVPDVALVSEKAEKSGVFSAKRPAKPPIDYACSIEGDGVTISQLTGFSSPEILGQGSYHVDGATVTVQINKAPAMRVLLLE